LSKLAIYSIILVELNHDIMNRTKIYNQNVLFIFVNM